MPKEELYRKYRGSGLFGLIPHGYGSFSERRPDGSFVIYQGYYRYGPLSLCAAVLTCAGWRHDAGIQSIVIGHDVYKTDAWSWRWGSLEGKAVVENPSFKFTGHFSKGKRNGFGREERADGSVYEGQWKDGLFHGDNNLYYPPPAPGVSKCVHTGKWDKGNSVGDHHVDIELTDPDGPCEYSFTPVVPKTQAVLAAVPQAVPIPAARCGH